MSESQEELMPDEVIHERYRIVRKLGEGGMGAVYEAEHILMQKRVALKVLHRGLAGSEDVRARFEREAVAAASIEHACIAAATDFGSLADGTYYLVLEYVDGKSLREVLDEMGALDFERVFQISYQIASALSAAHKNGIIHRDLKPENIMLLRVEDEDFVKVLDFGIAKMHDEEAAPSSAPLTRKGTLFGTPEYMAPEQARGLSVDQRADIYALGMMMYEMLSGKPAFSGENLVEVLTAQMSEQAKPLPEEIPADFSSLVLRMLDKDPDARPDSAEQTLRALGFLAETLGYSYPAPRTSTGALLDSQGKHASQISSSFIHSPTIRMRSLEEDALVDFERPSMFESLRGASKKKVQVGKRRFSLLLPLLVLLCSAALAAYFLNQKREEARQREEVAEAQEQARAFLRLVKDCRAGDRQALSELRRYMSEKGEEQQVLGTMEMAQGYMALGHGYAKIEHYLAAIKAYRKAIDYDPHEMGDEDLLRDMRAALGHRDSVEQASEFAFEELGAHGADMIYDVWRDHKGQPGMTAVVVRAHKLISEERLDEQASPALKVALLLDRAKYCAQYREILPQAEQYADTRSLRKLNALLTKTGCGPRSQTDCFPCLRDDEAPLIAAQQKASGRAAPSYLEETPALEPSLP